MRQSSFIAGTKGFLKAAEKWVRFQYMITKEACHRAKILTFWQKHGLAAAKEAFNVSRPTLYRWRQALIEGRGNLESLNPGNRAPKNKRKSKLKTQSGIETEIIRLRTEHPRLGKEKLQPLLDEYCTAHSLLFLSVSTVGQVLKSLKERKLLPAYGKVKLTKTGKLLQNPRKKHKKQRLPKEFKAVAVGELIQLDTITQFITGLRRYMVTAVDVHGKFAFAYGYSHLSSAAATNFLEKLLAVAPFSVRQIQTDNGSEFAKYFQQAIDRLRITHFHTYPKSPKMNAYIERFNRTVQYEFANYQRRLWAYNLEEFNHQLMDWLIWYNTKRVHHSLGNTTPLDYLIKINHFTPAESHMYVTHTEA